MVKIMIVDNHSLMRRAVREVIEQEQDLCVVGEASNDFEAETLAMQTQPDVILMDPHIPGGDGFDALERLHVCAPQACVVIFVAAHEEPHVLQALQHGAMGYLTKDVEPEALLHAIRCAARNDLCIPSTLAPHVVARLRTLWHGSATPWPPPSEQSENNGLSFIKAFISCWSPVPDMMTSMGTLAYRTPPPRTRRMRKPTPPEDATPPMPRPLTGREQQILDMMRCGRKNREIARDLCIAESTVHKHVQNIFEKLNARNRTEAIYLTQ